MLAEGVRVIQDGSHSFEPRFGVIGWGVKASPSAQFEEGGIARGDNGGGALHGFEDGETEAFVEAGIEYRGGVGIEGG